MAEATNSPVFLVDAFSDPVVVRIEGRACFTNSAGLKEFFKQMVAGGRTRFVLDFQHCASMDSTFLGVLAGEALELRRLAPPGSLALCRIGRRNLELVRNLGLHRLLTVDGAEAAPSGNGAAAPLPGGSACSELEHARLVLEAHENLVAADSSNEGKFQDLMGFLRRRVEQA